MAVKTAMTEIEGRDFVGKPLDVAALMNPSIERLIDSTWRMEPVDWNLSMFWSFARWFEPCIVGEIGFQRGISTAAFLIAVRDYGGHVYSMDIDECGDGREALRELDLDANHTFIHGDSGKESFPEMLDILFIDGDHSPAAVKRDRERHIGNVRNGGLILYHDTNWPGIGEYLSSVGVAMIPLGAGLGVEVVGKKEKQVVAATQQQVSFKSENFANREVLRPAYDRVAEVLMAELDFENAIDIGSGQGFLVDALLAHGIDVYGIELAPEALAYASPQAAERTSIGNVLWSTAGKVFDLACCVEVAEHVAPEHSVRLVERVCDFTMKQVFFTAASPYQPGHGHINCRPATDWIYFFSKRGFRLDVEKTIDIRARLGALEAAPWISMNTMLFVKEN